MIMIFHKRGQISPEDSSPDTYGCSIGQQKNIRHSSFSADYLATKSLKGLTCELKRHHESLEYNELPSYIESRPPHITIHDLQFLSSRNAFLIPDFKARKDLWMAYWKYAHPCVPVLDQTEMIRSMQGFGKKISLLLYQCVMLVGQVFLNAHEGPLKNYSDTHKLFSKVRSLYDLGWETRPLVTLQALILMTFFPQKVNESKGQASLVGHAVSIAYKMGLHRDPTNYKIQASVRHWRKRLWWSLFIRERTLILDLGTPWIIGTADYDVPMMRIEDFCLPDVCRDLGVESLLEDMGNISRQRKIAMMWIERAKLAVIMGQLPSLSVHIPEGKSYLFEKPYIHSGLPGIAQSFNDVVASVGRWQRNIPSEIGFTQLNSPALWVGDFQIYLQHTTLRLLYHTVKFQLAVLEILSKGQTAQHPHEWTMSGVSESCYSIMRIIGDLQLYGCSAHVPLYGTSVLRPVLIWAILMGIHGKNARQGSIIDPLQFDIAKVDSYQYVFKCFLQLK